VAARSAARFDRGIDHAGRRRAAARDQDDSDRVCRRVRPGRERICRQPAAPGGNITGFINIESSLSGKWIEMLKDIVPRATRAALMFNPETAPYFAYYPTK
jgi:hypothetical protein